VNEPRIDDSNFTLVGGVMVPVDKARYVCRFCGAVYEARGEKEPDVGVKNHERQCRAKTRAMWTSAALQNAALTDKGPQAVRDAVDAQVALYDAMPRDTWVEHRGQ
jgi:hypothetical protein